MAPTVKNWEDFVGASFTGCTALQIATSTFALERRRWSFLPSVL